MKSDGELITRAGEAYDSGGRGEEGERRGFLITAAGEAYDSGRRADYRCGRGL